MTAPRFETVDHPLIQLQGSFAKILPCRVWPVVVDIPVPGWCVYLYLRQGLMKERSTLQWVGFSTEHAGPHRVGALPQSLKKVSHLSFTTASSSLSSR